MNGETTQWRATRSLLLSSNNPRNETVIAISLYLKRPVQLTQHTALSTSSALSCPSHGTRLKQQDRLAAQCLL
jgi:hypothetical protein